MFFGDKIIIFGDKIFILMAQIYFAIKKAYVGSLDEDVLARGGSLRLCRSWLRQGSSRSPTPGLARLCFGSTPKKVKYSDLQALTVLQDNVQ
jgi:hypothetical protein